ncbi:MAG: L-serine ammonia-lyase, iron-sulfur-dependent, subunit beta [Verrucomicrobia bacterium]|nr:L-serine ammonia-lyase, iron-sulfur-dependent, subunit beta [Cytophagales bacterium]
MASSIFDMIGPVMIGPSSSHTAGVVRIGNVGMKVLKAVPEKAVITFYNSFARTYEGHGSDRAIIAGLLGFATDDIRIRNAFDFAQEQGLAYTFQSVGNASLMHPNTVKLHLSKGEKSVEILGESRGGGVINITEIDGFRADFSGSLHTLMIKADDVKGTIAFIADVLANEDINIATMNVSRKGKNDTACHFIEIDADVAPIVLEYLRHLRWVKEVSYISPNL